MTCTHERISLCLLCAVVGIVGCAVGDHRSSGAGLSSGEAGGPGRHAGSAGKRGADERLTWDAIGHYEHAGCVYLDGGYREGGVPYFADYVILYDLGEGQPCTDGQIPFLALSHALEGAARGLPRDSVGQEAAASARAGDLVGSLSALVAHPDPHVSQAAITALGWLGDSRAVGVLIGALRDTRGVSYEGCLYPKWSQEGRPPHGGDTGYPYSMGSTGHAEAAASALGRIGDPRAVPALVSLLTDPDPGIRANAAAALGDLGAREALPALRQAAEDAKSQREPWLIEWTTRAITQVAAKGKDQSELIADLGSEGGFVCYYAVRELGARGGPEALDALAGLFSDGRFARRDCGTPTIVEPISHAARVAAAAIEQRAAPGGAAGAAKGN